MLKSKNFPLPLLLVDELKDISVKDYLLCDKSGERAKRHFNVQVLTKCLYNEGVREINKNKGLLNIYYNLPLHEGRNGSMRSANELQGVFVIYVALEKLEPSAIFRAYQKLSAGTVEMTNSEGVTLPNDTKFGFERAICPILYFYITKFNPHRFENSVINKIKKGMHREIEAYMLRDIIFLNRENDTFTIGSLLDDTIHNSLLSLLNKLKTIKFPEYSEAISLKFFKNVSQLTGTVSDVATSSMSKSESDNTCFVM